MDHIASLELSKQLYELSGWDDIDEEEPQLQRHFIQGGQPDIPAYSLDFLMRKLPGHYIQKLGNGSYSARWTDYAPTAEQREQGLNHLSGQSKSSPENALCRLAIELFQQGILKRKGDE